MFTYLVQKIGAARFRRRLRTVGESRQPAISLSAPSIFLFSSRFRRLVRPLLPTGAVRVEPTKLLTGRRVNFLTPLLNRPAETRAKAEMTKFLIDGDFSDGEQWKALYTILAFLLADFYDGRRKRKCREPKMHVTLSRRPETSKNQKKSMTIISDQIFYVSSAET